MVQYQQGGNVISFVHIAKDVRKDSLTTHTSHNQLHRRQSEGRCTGEDGADLGKRAEQMGWLLKCKR